MPGTGATGASYGDLLVTSLVVLGGVCLAAFVMVRLVSRLFATGRTQGGHLLDVVARVPLEPRRSLYVVEVAGKTLLLGTSEMGLSLLSELDPVEVRARIVARPSFGALVHSAWLRRRTASAAEPRSGDRHDAMTGGAAESQAADRHDAMTGGAAESQAADRHDAMTGGAAESQAADRHDAMTGGAAESESLGLSSPELAQSPEPARPPDSNEPMPSRMVDRSRAPQRRSEAAEPAPRSGGRVGEEIG